MAARFPFGLPKSVPVPASAVDAPASERKDGAERAQLGLSSEEVLNKILEAGKKYSGFSELTPSDQRAAAILAEKMGFPGTAVHWRALAEQQERAKSGAAEENKRNGERAASDSHQKVKTYNSAAFNSARARSAARTTAALNFMGNPLTEFFQTAIGKMSNFLGGAENNGARRANADAFGDSAGGSVDSASDPDVAAAEQAYKSAAKNALPGMAEMGTKMAGIAGVIDQVGKSILSFFKVLTGGDRIEVLPDGTEVRTPQPLFPFIQYAIELGQKILTAFSFAALGAQEIQGLFKAPGSDLTEKQKRVDHGGAYTNLVKKLPEDIQKELNAEWDADQSAGHMTSWRDLRTHLEKQALVKPELTPELLPFVDADEQDALQKLQAKANPPKSAAEVKGLQEWRDLEEVYRNSISAAKELVTPQSSLEFQRKLYDLRKEMHHCATNSAWDAEQRLSELIKAKDRFDPTRKVEEENRRAMREAELEKEQLARQEAESKFAQERKANADLAARLWNLERLMAQQGFVGGAGPGFAGPGPGQGFAGPGFGGPGQGFDGNGLGGRNGNGAAGAQPFGFMNGNPYAQPRPAPHGGARPQPGPQPVPQPFTFGLGPEPGFGLGGGFPAPQPPEGSGVHIEEVDDDFEDLLGAGAGPKPGAKPKT